MSFSNTIFVFGALPIFLFAYWIAGRKKRHIVMFICSIFFYFTNEPRRIGTTVVLVLLNYVLAIWIAKLERSEKPFRIKAVLWAGIIVDFGALGFQKVTAVFTTGGIALLAGQSFFTFTMAAYLVDVYYKRAEVQTNVIKYVNSILMFPKVLMGPITRFTDHSKMTQMTLHDLNEGIKRFMIGFCKKTIVADNLALLVLDVNSAWESSSVMSVWLGSIAFSLQLYFDFSGYTDMALGLGRMFGFQFRENFHYPYCCSSVQDFWKRWHISLSAWFRDFVYIPLGGSRKGPARTVVNLFLVWILTGLWHGNGFQFIVWSIVYFIVLVCERFVVKPEQLRGGIAFLYRLSALLVINFNWVIFSHEEVRTGLAYCLHMLGYRATSLADAGDIRLMREYGIYILSAFIGSTPLVSNMQEKYCENSNWKKLYIFLEPFVLLALFAWGISFELLGGHNPFMYKNF